MSGGRDACRSLTIAVVACAIAGVMTAGVTLTFDRGDAPDGEVSRIATDEYGRRLFASTPRLIGPDQPDPARRFTRSGLSCGSCHLGAGAEPGTLSLLQAAERYPRFSARDGETRDLDDRINGCMTRSMNGRVLPRDGAELMAIRAYILGLGRLSSAMGASRRVTRESPAFAAPDRAASVEAGRVVFEARCARCHGNDGAGLRASGEPIEGYVFPPLWGPNSYNIGAGMSRVLTAAQFIKARMPLGDANLTDEEAFDVAAYINAQPRPAMANLERDYPDRSLKPIDSPYGPYADGFPIEQHRIGPFAPIAAYYKARNAASGTR